MSLDIVVFRPSWQVMRVSCLVEYNPYGGLLTATGADDSLKLSPAKNMSLEEALEFIEDDELIEVTPLSFRIRKKILEANKRYKSKK